MVMKIYAKLAIIGCLFTFCAPEEVHILTKTDWQGKDAKVNLTQLQLPVGNVIIAHTVTSDCVDKVKCAQILRTIQSFHMDEFNWDDIAYNFMVGNDGNVYEGRSWNNQGAHTRDYNVGSIGIAFVGTFTNVAPAEKALYACKMLIADGVRLGKIAADYKLFGARQLQATESPGKALYNIIKEWPHWSSK